MKTIEISQFCKDNSLVEVSKLTRKNSNGFGYVTFIDKSNNAMNVYFSKSLDSEVAEGTPITKAFFSNKTIAEVENGEGEVRYKICNKDSQRIDVSDLF